MLLCGKNSEFIDMPLTLAIASERFRKSEWRLSYGCKKEFSTKVEAAAGTSCI